MNVDFAFVCDYAEPGNKVSALGIGFDTIFASQVPCALAMFHLVLQLRVSIAEVGHKDVEVRLIDADGKDVVSPVTTSLDIPEAAPGALDNTGKLVVGFAGVAFPSYGHYALHVVVQGHEMARIPIRVAQPPTTA